jgi:hypothetical protein
VEYPLGLYGMGRCMGVHGSLDNSEDDALEFIWDGSVCGSAWIWVFGVLDTGYNARLHSFGFIYVCSFCSSDST